jgi:hypothetical protein
VAVDEGLQPWSNLKFIGLPGSGLLSQDALGWLHTPAAPTTGMLNF